jgi:hypothetical protein
MHSKVACFLMIFEDYSVVVVVVVVAEFFAVVTAIL